MTFEEILNETLEMLERQGRVSYRALKRQFSLDDDYLADLKFEIIEVHRRGFDQDGTMLVWAGKVIGAPDSVSAAAEDRTSTSLSRSSTELPTSSANPAQKAPGPALAVTETRPPTSTVSPANQDGERRQLTVMFCDLVGSTALSEALDPEDLREILNLYHDFTQKAIVSYDGYIAKYMGDGLLIYFGYPQAHEDDAIRAVRSGLRILEAVTAASTQFVERWGVSLGVRLGVHTGLVIAGEMGVGEVRETHAIVGETPNIAARLQGLAESNTLVISAATYRLVSGYFECTNLGLHSVKGITEPVQVYQVGHENAARSRFDVAVEGNLTPLTGRDRELQFLKSQWEQACEGQSQAVLLCGEAGIGKSRLVWETKRFVAQQPGTWLTECAASQYHRNSAFYPVIELLERVMQFGRQDSAEEKLVKAESFLMQYGLPLPEHLPLFAALLSLPYEHRYSPLGLSPEHTYQKTLISLATILRRRAAQQPMLFVVEDLHWLDTSTLDLLRHLLLLEPSVRLLMLFTSRPEFVPPWGTQSQCKTLELKNLLEAQTEEIIQRVAGGKELPPEIMRQIVQKTDGNPLYVEEMTKSVLESRLLIEGETRYELAGALGAMGVPFSLQDSLVARLDRLSVVKEVAQLGATLARQFDYELFAAVSPWSEEELQKGLAQLVAAEVLYQHGTPPRATYKFKHALIQDAAYASLLKSRRLQYHLRIAQVLEAQFNEIVLAQPEQLAHHYTQSGVASHAVPYWIKAGQLALRRFATLDAVAHLAQGLKTIRELPEGEVRNRQELEIHLGLAPAQMSIRGWASVEVEQACRRIHELSSTLNDTQNVIFALWGLWTNYFLRSQHDDALATAEEVMRLGEQMQIQMLHVPSCHAVGYTRFFRGEYRLALDVAERGLAHFDLESERTATVTFQLSPTCNILAFRSSAQWVMGYPDQARKSILALSELGEQLANPPTHAYVLASNCFHHQMIRDIERVEGDAAQLIEFSKAQGFVMWGAQGMVYHGWAVAIQADATGNQAQFDRGFAEANDGLMRFLATGSKLTLPQTFIMLAELHSLAGRNAEALAMLDEGLQLADHNSEHHLHPELYRMKGECLSQREVQDGECATNASSESDAVDENGATGARGRSEAESNLVLALTLARQQGALLLALRANLSLSRYLVAQGRRSEAYSSLATIYAEFTEGWDTPELIEAKTLLAAWKIESDQA